MIPFETIATIQTIINLAGIGGAAFWARRWFKALNGAIAAQKTTIESQKTMIDGMATYLNAMDIRSMTERFEAYKRLVDLEKDAVLTRAEEDFKNENQSLVHASNDLESRLRESEDTSEKLLDLLVETRFELALIFKMNPLDWELTKDRLRPPLRSSLEKIMEGLPQPPHISRPSEVFTGTLNDYLGAARKNLSEK